MRTPVDLTDTPFKSQPSSFDPILRQRKVRKRVECVPTYLSNVEAVILLKMGQSGACSSEHNSMAKVVSIDTRLH